MRIPMIGRVRLSLSGQWFGLVTAMVAAPWLAMAEGDGQWPNWRGPDLNGSVATGNYPERWDAEQPLWKVRLPGKGTSTPIVWNERIYVTSPDEGRDAVLAFELSGKEKWRTKLGEESGPKHQRLASSCNASPVTDGEGVFVYFRSGTLAAVEFEGTVRWQLNIAEEFGPEKLFWDQGTSPVVTKQHVVLARLHGGDSWVAGFDKATGEMRWQTPRNYQTPPENDNGYTTPVLYERDGRQALLVWGADHLTAHDAATGALLWSCGGFNPEEAGYWPAIASPLVLEDRVIVPVGRDDRNQASVHAIRLGGSGDVTESHRLWKQEDFGVFVASPAEYKGRVYLLRDRGEVICMDPANGRKIWSEALPRHRSSYYSSPVIANGILYAAREDGTVFSVRVEDGFELAGENAMGERIIATPVPVQNRLLIRGDEHLFCVGSESVGR